MSSPVLKDTEEILELIRQSQAGNSRAEGKLIVHFSTYIQYMVKRYSKRTEIKDDDDLKSYIMIGLLEAIRTFKFNKNIKFSSWAFIWMKKVIFLSEIEHRFIKLPVNQKTFYTKFQEDLMLFFDYLNDTYSDVPDEIYESIDQDIDRYHLLYGSNTHFFTDLMQMDEESGIYEIPDNLLLHHSLENLNEVEDKYSSEILKNNVNKVLRAFNEKEVYIIERLYGLNGQAQMSSEQIAINLDVTKVNITFTKTRVIRMLRHSSFSNQLLTGI